MKHTGSGAVDVIREPPAEPAPVDIIIRRTSTSSVHRELEQVQPLNLLVMPCHLPSLIQVEEDENLP